MLIGAMVTCLLVLSTVLVNCSRDFWKWLISEAIHERKGPISGWAFAVGLAVGLAMLCKLCVNRVNGETSQNLVCFSMAFLKPRLVTSLKQ